MFVWRYLDTDGGDAGASDPFETREAAEDWMGEEWAALLDRGVERVELVEGERRLYRMGLRET